MSDSHRKKQLKQDIQETQELLSEWEEKRRYSENPNERKRSEIEIKRLQSYIKEYKEELAELESTNSNQNIVKHQTENKMTYEEFKDFVAEKSIPEIFEFLDKFYDKMDAKKTTYNQIKKEYESNETSEIKLKERLLVLGKKFLA